FRLRRWVPLSVAATLVLAVAGVFVLGVNDRGEGLAAGLAPGHVQGLKGDRPAAPARPGAARRPREPDHGRPAQVAHNRPARPLVVPQTDPSRQLELVKVRRCFTTDGRAAHMMYTWRGEPLSVYVLQGDAGRDRIVHKMGTQAIVWCANQRTYAVVAGDTGQ